jgi:BirA family biotin operon repressor/biotin-[acetyl-CoA-carboxylase] ligase
MSTPPAEHLNWGAEALWQRLEPLLPGLSVEVVARLESTNTRLLDRARAHAGSPDAPVTRPGELQAQGGAPEHTPFGRRSADLQPCLLVAEHQIRGRGRLGRDWLARPGASLTFSLALPLAPVDWSGLSLAVGLALAEALDPLPAPDAAVSDASTSGPSARDASMPAAPASPTGPRIWLKWPNDLWLLDEAGAGADGGSIGRKLGGVLIETVSVGTHRMCVVGIGLNVRPQTVDDGLSHGYACLAELEPDIDAPTVLARVAEPLVRALLRFQTEGFAPLAPAYARRDLLAGRPVTTTHADVPAGVAEGVDARGALRVRSGTLHSLVSGEVSVRLQPPPGAPAGS